ncbi:ornithine cyclodeaminase family protein [Microscilla marina]|uniref:Ornithine cyclodeaminase/mu-crystallin family protein n=1 Tax=Microscilla marina ATCC 23134 TaxID=313606 RepID=A1ZHM7_MICM2|nr:ornithine cyclodeaminase family protein [Microscilla marina]EAY30034.1 ornithine cyclodeaminase/mu-crystallin family protein [Microscilla marina ATCC 23134]
MQKIRILSRHDVQTALPMADAIKAMRESFTWLYQQRAQLPPRTEMAIKDANADVLMMPVYIPDYQQMGLKIANVFRENPAQNLPLIQGLMLLINTQNGQAEAIMDSTYLTAMRTAAGSALATDVLANPDAQTLAIFGTGANAITHLEALCLVRDINKVYIFGRSLAKAQAFVQAQQAHCSALLEATDDLAALAEASIVCTTTSASTPLFDANYIQPGTHINAIGTYKPHLREVPGKLVAKSRIVVDYREACLKEAGDILMPLQEGLIDEQDVLAELGEVLTTGLTIRKSAQDITFYKSVGVGTQDLTAAHYILQKANELNLGTLLEV